MAIPRPRIAKLASPPFWHGPWELSVPLKNPRGVGRRHFDTWRQAFDELVACFADPDRWPDSDLKRAA